MKYLRLVNQNVQELHKARGRMQAGPPNGPTMTVQQTLVIDVVWVDSASPAGPLVSSHLSHSI